MSAGMGEEGARKTRRGEIFVMQIPRQYFFFINIENVFFSTGGASH